MQYEGVVVSDTFHISMFVRGNNVGQISKHPFQKSNQMDYEENMVNARYATNDDTPKQRLNHLVLYKKCNCIRCIHVAVSDQRQERNICPRQQPNRPLIVLN